MNHDGMSSIGIEEGTVAACSYFCGLGLIMLLVERKSDFVKFHSLQSVLGYVVLGIWWLMVNRVPGMGLLWWSPGLLACAFTLFMAFHAYHGEERKFPVIGNLAFAAVYDTGPEREDFLAKPAQSDPSNDENQDRK